MAKAFKLRKELKKIYTFKQFKESVENGMYLVSENYVSVKASALLLISSLRGKVNNTGS